MKLISWNVNGLRACIKKGFMDFLASADADILCLQETKMQEGQEIIETPGYHQFWCSAEKKGYSGTLTLTKEKPLSVSYGIGIDIHDHEGRAVTAEFNDFYLVNFYVPNSQDQLKRLAYRMQWEYDVRDYLSQLRKSKPVIVCGDMNVAAEEIDLKNPKTNRKNAGFSDEEREKFRQLKASGFIDTFRYFYPDLEGVYSWWSYRFNARKNNAGWRIDYFLASEELESRLSDAKILTDVMGSDHCPVVLELK
ncbi:exodeoxyribonuclease III [Gallibacter intestinalis]|uniref:Exodeoxyribonuclease III n=1 Tax=Gallibacter intestinalis TaxID=2779356 RepID=A0ABR9QY51_9FIRM|nr:exodeoxyribonuclease III [Gallibacter intestinalis]MBE5035773.1 exodeoxyribonuclease III [Gallibacter intestinalis]